ncbi:MAG: hypothetical protein FJX64_09285, partial [Alphaproteobacteria bacterium]|nr:hypothetical protein [Alphaproteobacteria bacterium]
MTPLAPVPANADYDPPPEYLCQGPQPAPQPPERRGGVGRTLTAGIAVVTLSAFAGGVWFAYEEGVRRGLELSPPLVRADPSPTRIVPVEPGGMVVANQDKRVFDAIAAVAPAPRVEQLLPPPETPMAPPLAEPRVAPPARATDVAPPARATDVAAPAIVTPPIVVAERAPVAAGATHAMTPVPDAVPQAAAPLAQAPNGVPVPPR